MLRLPCVCFFIALACSPAWSQSSDVTTTGVDADRAQSDALSPDRRSEAQILFREAFELSRNKQFEAARLLFERGLAIDPANVEANFFLAQTFQQLNDKLRAQIFYNKVIALGPGSANSLKSSEALRTLLAPPDATNQTHFTVPLTTEQERRLKAADAFKECEKCPEMVVVPAGTFIMGSPKDEEGHINNEEPQHTVTFAQPFAVGKFTVTFDEWDACADDGGCNNYKPLDKGWGRGKQPVIYISWKDTKSYLAWISRKTGKTYRLLSEAEREYVTRAGTTTPFWWGAQLSTNLANYNGDYAFQNGPKGENRKRTLPVDTFFPNPWGLYQMHGNVSEWMEDCWHESYKGAPENGAAWTDGGDCKVRFVRGGSWDDLPIDIRAARRANGGPSQRNYAVGFRVVRTLIN